MELNNFTFLLSIALRHGHGEPLVLAMSTFGIQVFENDLKDQAFSVVASWQ